MWHPGAHRSTSSPGQASPPTISVRKCGKPFSTAAEGTVASAAGGISAWVTPLSASTSASCSPSSGPGGGTTSAAPAGSDMQSSNTEASKLGEEYSSTRSPGATAYLST